MSFAKTVFWRKKSLTDQSRSLKIKSQNAHFDKRRDGERPSLGVRYEEGFRCLIRIKPEIAISTS
jgi:hypothetical protein